MGKAAAPPTTSQTYKWKGVGKISTFHFIPVRSLTTYFLSFHLTKSRCKLWSHPLGHWGRLNTLNDWEIPRTKSVAGCFGRDHSPASSSITPPPHSGTLFDKTTALWWGSRTLAPSAHLLLSFLEGSSVSQMMENPLFSEKHFWYLAEVWFLAPVPDLEVINIIHKGPLAQTHKHKILFFNISKFLNQLERLLWW